MGLYFYGDYQRMLQVRDEILLVQMGYKPACKDRGKFTPEYVISPDGIIWIEFPGQSPIKVCIQKKSMISDTGFKETARPHLERMVELFHPQRITDVGGTDVTATLNIRKPFAP